VFLTTHRLCGQPIEIACDAEAVGRRIDALWTRFFMREAGAHARQPRPVRLSLESTREATTTAGTGAPLRVERSVGGYRVLASGASVEVDFARAAARGRIEPRFWSLPPGRQRGFLLTALVLLLHPRDVYGLHANGMTDGRRGWLFIGRSGSGKTTLSVALASTGWRWLGDDVVLLRREGRGVTAAALHRGLSCAAETAARFPSLGASWSAGAPLRDGKRLLDAPRRLPRQPVPRLRPQVLVFLDGRTDSASRVRPLDTKAALARLMEHSPGLLLDADLAPGHLETLRRMAERCVRLAFCPGGDVFDDPRRVADLLRGTARPGRP
jgi:hypothetical protein